MLKGSFNNGNKSKCQSKIERFETGSTFVDDGHNSILQCDSISMGGLKDE
jgi:hypothetical protein